MFFLNLISPFTSHHFRCQSHFGKASIIYLARKNNSKSAHQRKFSSTGGNNAGSSCSGDDFKSIKYWTENKGRVAHLMLNRPFALNAIDHEMPVEIERAIKLANWDDSVKVILLYGAENAFCSGYDLKLFSEGKRGEMMGNQEMPWCPLIDFRLIFRSNALWRKEREKKETVICLTIIPILSQGNESMHQFLYGNMAEHETSCC